ncbi:hypothetical protein HNR74_002169 [Flammeovirga kamogawensis]|nr:hypothetical protein [Flammeovirga kamogawensis]
MQEKNVFITFLVFFYNKIECLEDYVVVKNVKIKKVPHKVRDFLIPLITQKLFLIAVFEY